MTLNLSFYVYIYIDVCMHIYLHLYMHIFTYSYMYTSYVANVILPSTEAYVLQSLRLKDKTPQLQALKA